jgi:prephenate dehydratase
MKVAVQGGNASFHDIATRFYFEKNFGIAKPDLICCNTFKEVFEHLISGEADYAALAIENSIAGSILGNYKLLQQYDVKIIGEIKLRIILDLMALPNQKIEDIHTVRSHYMALLQCDDLLSQYPHLKHEEAIDTADSARDIRRDLQLGVAAIASRIAAEDYQLNIIASGIEDDKQNYTRFFILSRNETIENPEKATLSFQLQNETGSLSNVLSIFNEFEVNLTKIQSLPRIGFHDEYTFHIDCDWKDYNDYKESIRKIKTMVSDLKILGEYKKGDIHNAW